MLDLVDKRSDQFPYCIVDAPGQIEAFTWSASGAIIADAFASRFPTVVAYVVDSARSTNPTTFMSNMLYACSILYRMKLPFFLVLNKVSHGIRNSLQVHFQADIVDPQFIEKWMQDYEQLGSSIEDARDGYINNLTHSLSLVLDEFYSVIPTVKVSSKTGEGLDKVLEAIQKAKTDYFETYQPAYNALLKEKLAKDVQDTAGKVENITISEKAEGSEEK